MPLRSTNIHEEINNFRCDWMVLDNNATASLIDASSDTELIINYPFPIEKEGENYSSCKVYLFKNRFYSREDHYYNVTCNDKRLGVIFPLKIYYETGELPVYDLSIKSSVFLYRFLHIAFYHLIMDGDLPSKTVNLGSISYDNIKITDFFDDETVVFLYHDGTNSFPANINKFYPSLFKYGYVPLINEKELKEIEMITVDYIKQPLYNHNIQDALQLNECQSDIINERFIDQIFSSTLKFYLTPLSRFILLYQVIELLIDRIAFLSYQSNFLPISTLAIKLDTVNKSKSYRDTYTRLLELKSKLDSSVENVKTEEKRIYLLLNDICNLSVADYPVLIALSKNIVGSSRTCSTLHEYVYQLRNRIVHDYYNLSLESSNIDEEMSRLNIEFERMIADVIIRYKETITKFNHMT